VFVPAKEPRAYPSKSKFQWKRINRKQSARWQHLFQLKASALLFEKKLLGVKETQQLILEIGNAI
jgi:hypothetical protein